MSMLTLAVAAYRVESFIAECLESIRAQTNQDFALMVIDDGSPDGTGALIDDFARTFPKARVLHQANEGISLVRNRMMELCETPYLWMIDGDDTLPPDAVETLLPCLDGKRDAIYFSYTKYGDPAQGAFSRTLTDLTAEQLCALRYKCMLNDANPLLQNINANSSVMSALRVALLRETNVTFEPGRRVGGDVLFTSNVLRVAKNVAYLDASLYLYRVNEGSVSLSYRKGLTEENLDLLEVFQTYINAYYPGDAHMRRLFMGRVLGTACASLQLEICHPNNRESFFRRRARYKALLSAPLVREALSQCPVELLRRNPKVYRAFMRLGLFLPADLFAHIIMTKRYLVFRARGGRVKK